MPLDPHANYLGDEGAPGTSKSYSFIVSKGQQFEVVVSEAKKSGGSDCPSYTVTVTSRPAARTDPAGATDTSATLNGILNPRGLKTTYHFELTPGGLSTDVTSFTGDIGRDQAIVAVITGLTPGTAYTYQLVATNSDGTTRADPQTFTTTGFAPLSGATDFALGRTDVEPDGTIDLAVTAKVAGVFKAIGTVDNAVLAKATARAAKKKCKKGFVRKGKKCKPGPGKTTYGTGEATAPGPGPVQIKVHPDSAVKRALKKRTHLPVVLAVVFSPAGAGAGAGPGGLPTSKTTTVAVQLKKHKKKRKKGK